MYIYINIYIYVYIHLHVCVHMYKYIYTSSCIHNNLYIYIGVYTYIHAFLCVCTRTDIACTLWAQRYTQISTAGVGLLDPHINAHIFTIHCGLPSCQSGAESDFALGYSCWHTACEVGRVPNGMVRCTGFQMIGAGPSMRHASMT